jgi:hypothetical protein
MRKVTAIIAAFVVFGCSATEPDPTRSLAERCEAQTGHSCVLVFTSTDKDSAMAAFEAQREVTEGCVIEMYPPSSSRDGFWLHNCRMNWEDGAFYLFVLEEPSEWGTGAVFVRASTTGDYLDPDGYTCHVTGQQGQQQMPGDRPNETWLFNDLRLGNYTVELTGLADNCEVSGDNPRTVTISNPRTVTDVVFTVTCEARTGTLGSL